MSGLIQGSGDHSSAGPHSVPLALARNGRLSPTSPLKVFGQAKKKINDIFVELSHYIDEGVEFLNGEFNFAFGSLEYYFYFIINFLFCHLLMYIN